MVSSVWLGLFSERCNDNIKARVAHILQKCSCLFSGDSGACILAAIASRRDHDSARPYRSHHSLLLQITRPLAPPAKRKHATGEHPFHVVPEPSSLASSNSRLSRYRFAHHRCEFQLFLSAPTAGIEEPLLKLAPTYPQKAGQKAGRAPSKLY